MLAKMRARFFFLILIINLMSGEKINPNTYILGYIWKLTILFDFYHNQNVPYCTAIEIKIMRCLKCRCSTNALQISKWSPCVLNFFFAIHSILLIQWRTLDACLFAKRQIYNFMDSSQWQIEACDNERYGCIKINDRKGVCCKCSRKWMCVFVIFDSVHQFNATQLNSIRMNHRCMKWNCSKFIFTIFVPMLSKVLFVHPITPIVTLH